MYKPEILLADDNKTDQFVVKRMLEQLNCNVHIVENGFEAVDAIRKQKYDLVFMDQLMPVLSGTEATKVIRELPDMADLPIIAISADNDLDAEVCFNAGMNDLLSKPVAIYKFNQILVKWIADYENQFLADTEAS